MNPGQLIFRRKNRPERKFGSIAAISPSDSDNFLSELLNFFANNNDYVTLGNE